MSLILSGTDGLSDVDGSAATPAIRGTDANTGIFFPAADTVGVSTGGSERVRVDSSGNVGIGTASPAYPLTLGNNKRFGALNTANAGVNFAILDGSNNLTFGDDSSNTGTLTIQSRGNTLFSLNGSERMRIDSSGNLLVGTTNTSATAGVGMKFIVSVDASNPVIKSVVADGSGAYSTYNLYSTNAGAYRFFVTTAGIVNATTTTITAISDQRLKENIRDLDDGLEKVLALKPRKFDWKENKGENIKNARGFIAQELELVFPDMISNWIDEPPEGEEPYKAVNANLIPTLVKAIQEQQALIQSLTARITALETQNVDNPSQGETP